MFQHAILDHIASFWFLKVIPCNSQLMISFFNLTYVVNNALFSKYNLYSMPKQLTFKTFSN